MDYLDPKKKKLKNTRLMIGYALLGIAISITTVLIVYLANGYYIDSETGTIIQNGLIYVDSKPESAEIYLNGQLQRGSTDARLVVPEGLYNIELKRTGYRPWLRKLQLEGGALRRLTYARLIPETLESEIALNLPSAPTMSTQSIDKRWLVMAFSEDPLLMRFVDLQSSVFQLGSLPLPIDLLNTKEAGQWIVLDWADDNRTFLAEYKTAKTSEYVLIDRADATKSQKISSIFASGSYSDISLRNRKKDLLFLHNKKTGTLTRASSNTGVIEPYLAGVIDYTSFGNDSVLYVTALGANEGFVKAILKNGNEEYVLREIKKDTTYLLEMSKIGNALVMGIGNAAEGRVIVYNDPIKALNDNGFSTIPVPTTVLRVSNPQELSISADSSVILARSSNQIASHEFEADRSYNYKLDLSIDDKQQVRWVDGQHFTISVGGLQFIMDYDGSNQYELVKSIEPLGGYFDRNTDLLYTFTPQNVLSKAPSNIIRSFMRTPADR